MKMKNQKLTPSSFRNDIVSIYYVTLAAEQYTCCGTSTKYILLTCLSHQVKQGTKCLPATIVWLKIMYSVLFANELSTVPAPRIRPPMKTTTLAENRRLSAFERGPTNAKVQTYLAVRRFVKWFVRHRNTRFNC